MEDVKKSVSCGELFEKFNTLPVASECLFTLLSFTVNNTETLQSIQKHTVQLQDINIT
jgi:hypothetical protein